MQHESLLDLLLEEPLAEARRAGIQEGRELGARENAIHVLIEVLDARFDDSDVELFKPIFEAITDVQLLKQLHRTALHVPTFDDVIQTLRNHRNNGA